MCSRASLALALGLPAAVSFVSCTSLQTGAEASFARRYSCPEERVVIRERSDLRWSTLVLAQAAHEAPADEVKQDPERLAKWRRDKEQERRERAEALDRYTVFQATGCGREVLLGCAHPTTARGATAINQVLCTEAGPR